MSEKTFCICLMVFGGIPMAIGLGVWIARNIELIGAAAGLFFFAVGYAGYKEECSRESNPTHERSISSK